MGQGLAGLEVTEEDHLRAQWYGLLARLLSAAPDQALLTTVRGLTGDDSELGRSIQTLATAARAATPESLREEYFNLFVGVGRGEMLPFESYYLTGFLNEKPLARLRGDMDELGIARADNMKEPEDHIASLCEMMAGLITGAFGEPVDLQR
ncbi:MAG: TorD/DmsD family molecular chaperone, partial [Alphaproteobacteria bacterium]